MNIEESTRLMKLLFPLLAALLACPPALACTDFQIRAGDGGVVVGRSMEWAEDMHTKLCLHRKGEKRSSLAADGSPGLQWQSKYDFLAADGYDQDIALDGVNSTGLSVGLLWMPGSVYQPASEGGRAETVDILDTGAWLLGTCASVDEALAAISRVRVCARRQSFLGGIPTVHIALHDAGGKNAVVEYVDGKRRVYENPNGVLTNAPTFDWHMTNLRNYIHLSGTNPRPVSLKGTILDVPGLGGGFLGIPGDWTPPSRFVRATAMLTFAIPPASHDTAVNLAQHILNAVDIPRGNVRTGGKDATACDYTQWVLIKDLTNQSIYFRTYDNLNLRRVDLHQLAADGKPHAIPLAGGKPFESVLPR